MLREHRYFGFQPATGKERIGIPMKIPLQVLSLIFVLLLTACQAKPEAGVSEYTKTEVLNKVNIIEKYTSQLLAMPINNPKDLSKGGFLWDTEKKKDSWRYFNGVMLDAFASCGGSDGLNYVKASLLANINSDGSGKSYHAMELDSVPMGLSLFYFLEDEHAELFKKTIQFVYSELEKQPVFDQCGMNYLHKTTWKEYHIGLDGLYMAEPFLMRCASAIDAGLLTLKSADGTMVTAEELYELVFKRLHWVAENMCEPASGLYHHGWNAETSKGNGHFWSRGIGWFAVALVDIAELMPDEARTAALTADMQKLFDGMLKYADASTGLWYNIVNAAGLENNKLETSGSAMMAYSMLKAYNLGLVSESYAKAGLKAFNSLVETKVVEKDGLLSVIDVYQKSGVCNDDEGYTKNPYLPDEGKGTGLLIMAAKQAKAYTEK